MFLQLAFGISTSVEPEVLIMDEMISTFDVHFNEKAQRCLREIIDNANILALASHDMSVIHKSAIKLSGWSTERFNNVDRRNASCRPTRVFYSNVGLERTGARKVGPPSNPRAASLMPNAQGHPAVQV